MRVRKGAFVLLPLCILAVWTASGLSKSPLLPGLVTEVFDGDTIRVAMKDGSVETVRYIGIDTPETHHPHKGVEELGKAASRFNRGLVLNRQVRLETDVEARDRFGRLLAYVWLEDNGKSSMVNETILRKGYALIFTIPPNVRYSEAFRKAFMDARNSEAGLWKSAAGRVFTPSQVWSELPSLAGSFITLSITVDGISESNRRFTLNSGKGRTSLVVYKSDSPLFGSISALKGKRLQVVGKVVAGYSGAEVVLADPAQIISVD